MGELTIDDLRRLLEPDPADQSHDGSRTASDVEAWARNIFGSDARISVKGMGLSWSSTECSLEVDAAWFSSAELAHIAGSVRPVCARVDVLRLDRSLRQVPHRYRLVLRLSVRRQPGEAPRSLSHLGTWIPTSDTSWRAQTCEVCNADHRIAEARKPEAGRDSSEHFFVLCLACSRGTFSVSAWEGQFRVERPGADVTVASRADYEAHVRHC